jgi:hypothetical protein
MPSRPLGPCRVRSCSNRSDCPIHNNGTKDTRISAARRGYGGDWRKIREGVLRGAGVPKHLWPLYDVDHNPPYDPSIEPDHRAYTLVPRLHKDHSAKTMKENRPKRYTY